MLTTTITERALIGRINRKLAKENKKLCKAREGTRLHNNMGDYYVIDINRNIVIDYKLSTEYLMDWGRELVCVGSWESLA